mgnify:FL=1
MSFELFRGAGREKRSEGGGAAGPSSEAGLASRRGVEVEIEVFFFFFSRFGGPIERKKKKLFISLFLLLFFSLAHLLNSSTRYSISCSAIFMALAASAAEEAMARERKDRVGFFFGED